MASILLVIRVLLKTITDTPNILNIFLACDREFLPEQFDLGFYDIVHIESGAFIPYMAI